MLKKRHGRRGRERIRVDERAGTANFAVPVSAAPGRSAEHAEPERVGHDAFDRSDGASSSPSSRPISI